MNRPSTAVCVALPVPDLRPRWAVAIGAALLLTLLIALANPAHAAHTGHARPAAITGPTDTSRTVHHVVIDASGVTIDGTSSDSVEISSSSDGSPGFGHGHRVHVRPGNITVEPMRRSANGIGPVVTVDGGDGEDAGLVRVFADAEVPAGQTIDGDVVSVFGSATVHGNVTGSVVAVCGSVVLDSTARVGGDAVAVGGSLDRGPGSTVGGENVSLDFFPLRWGMPALPILLLTVGAIWLCTLLFAWLLYLIFPLRMLRVAVTSSRRTGLSLLMGLASAPLMVIACMLLLITIIGIPVALLLPVAYVLMNAMGQIAATHVLGSKLMRRPLGGVPSFAPVFAGTVFTTGFFFLGAVLMASTGLTRGPAIFFLLLGFLLVTALTTIGTGAFLVSRFGTHPADVTGAPSGV